MCYLNFSLAKYKWPFNSQLSKNVALWPVALYPAGRVSEFPSGLKASFGACALSTSGLVTCQNKRVPALSLFLCTLCFSGHWLHQTPAGIQIHATVVVFNFRPVQECPSGTMAPCVTEWITSCSNIFLSATALYSSYRLFKVSVIQCSGNKDAWCCNLQTFTFRAETIVW